MSHAQRVSQKNRSQFFNGTGAAATDMVSQDLSMDQIVQMCQAYNVPVDAVVECLQNEALLEGCQHLFGNKLQVLAMICELSAPIREGLANRTVRASEYTLYSVREVTAATPGEVKLYPEQTLTRTINVTNLENYKVSKNNEFLCTSMRLGFGYGTTAVPAGVDFFTERNSNGAIATANVIGWNVPVQLKNAEFTLKINNKQYFEKNPISRFDNYGTTNRIGELVLSYPFVIPELVLIDFNILLGTGGIPAGPVGSVTPFIRHEFGGVLFTPNS